MGFERRFLSWLDENCTADISDDDVAFSFNLCEPAGMDNVKFGVELVGAGSFGENDPDWACDEVWQAQPRGISIPLQYSGDTWQVCLHRMKSLAVKMLAGNSAAAQRLKSSQGVGIGFVDGDMEIIWRP
jgi:hypothetical protein